MEFERQKVYQLISPYLKKNTGYRSFCNGWRFPWESQVNQVQLPESTEEREALVKKALFNHQRILDKVKHDRRRT